MGIVLMKHGKPYVFEAVQPVKYTPLQAWLDRGKNKRYVVKRLAPPLSADDIARLHKDARHYEGKPYDLTFEWSDSKIYCSELVWKVYARALGLRLGDPQQLRDFDLSAPAVAAKLHERYGSAVPLDETVVSPAAIFASAALVTVVEE